jgi:hypothetical protein
VTCRAASMPSAAMLRLGGTGCEGENGDRR